MAYAKGRFTKRVTRRTSRRVSGNRRNYRSSMAYKAKRVITRRLNRREIKYDDDYYTLKDWSAAISASVGNATSWVNYVLGGVISVTGSNMAITNTNITDGQTGAYVAQLTFAPNCLTNVGPGNTAKTRIGNIIQPRFLTIKGVLEASKTNNPNDAETSVNQAAIDTQSSAQARYIRTSVKVYVVRDKHMNERGFVRYEDVFEPPDTSGGGTRVGAVNNPFLWNRKVDAVGRYEIIKTLSYDLDQDDPQKCFTCIIPMKGKAIRFNGNSGLTVVTGLDGMPMFTGTNSTTQAPGWLNTVGHGLVTSSEPQSMTNGIYLLAVSHSCSVGGLNASNFVSPSLSFSTRLTFED